MLLEPTGWKSPHTTSVMTGCDSLACRGLQRCRSRLGLLLLLARGPLCAFLVVFAAGLVVFVGAVLGARMRSARMRLLLLVLLLELLARRVCVCLGVGGCGCATWRCFRSL